MKSKALYAGSFDPITKGHLNIIERASGIFDSLTVAIAVNPNKSSLFTIEERVDIVREVTKHIPNVHVDTFTGLIADYVNREGFTAYIRGLRTTADFVSEQQMAQMNARLFNGNTETVFMMTDPAYSFISSSLVKEVALLGGEVDGFLPPYVSTVLNDKTKTR